MVKAENESLCHDKHHLSCRACVFFLLEPQSGFHFSGVFFFVCLFCIIALCRLLTHQGCGRAQDTLVALLAFSELSVGPLVCDFISPAPECNQN